MRRNDLDICIKQYTLRGDYVRMYINQTEIAQAGFSFTNIRRCCEGKLRQSQGFVWRFGNDAPSFRHTIKPRHAKIARPVYCFSGDGKRLLRKYDSVCYAAKMIRGKESGISACLGGLKTSYYGYIWRYADERERRRGKFRKKEDTGGEEHQNED